MWEIIKSSPILSEYNNVLKSAFYKDAHQGEVL